MDVALMFNPIAGRGKAARWSREVAQTLTRAGFGVERIETGPAAPRQDLAGSLRRVDVAVVIGGDGTVQRCATAIATSGALLYHLPTGTENLFAREFGMRRSVVQLMGALRQRRVRRIDMGLVRGTSDLPMPFLVMCSLGYDANVVHRLAGARAGSITQLSYVPHMVLELCRPAIAPLRVEVDGRVLVEGLSGTVIIANSRHYAARLDPAPMAEVDDGLLDVAFLPHRTRIGLVGRMVQSRVRRLDRTDHTRRDRGEHVLVTAMDRPMLVQADGEALLGPRDRPRPALAPVRTPISVNVMPGAMRVLLPPGINRASDCAPVRVASAMPVGAT